MLQVLRALMPLIWEEERLRIYENVVLRKIFRPRRGKVKGACR
jgi:hypothetical protein